MKRDKLNGFINNIDSFLSVELKNELSSIYTYGSNFNIINIPLVSNELDLVFVLKKRKDKFIRNSDIDRNIFKDFINKLSILFGESFHVIFNGEYPKNIKCNFYIDILIDNIPSIIDKHPTSIITSKLGHKLIWGVEVYDNLIDVKVSRENLYYLAKQKLKYLSRVYSDRDDSYSINAYIKGLRFICDLFLKYYHLDSSMVNELDILIKDTKKSPEDIRVYVKARLAELSSYE